MYQGERVMVGMPAYNEAENISAAVESFRSLDTVDGVLVVDNNSDDGTATLAEDAGASVVSERRQGYGHACRRALREMSERGADLLILVEPDGTFVATDVEKLLAYSSDFDFVVGTRTSPQLIWEGANMDPFLRWGNWFVGKLVEVLHNTSNLTDVGCTFRLISADAYDEVRDRFRIGGSHFSPHMLIEASREDISMIEVPVNYRSRKGTSKITGERWPAFKLGLVMIWLVVSEWYHDD